MIVIDTAEGKSFFEAVNQLNYDIEQLDKFMDKVCGLFIQAEAKSEE